MTTIYKNILLTISLVVISIVGFNQHAIGQRLLESSKIDTASNGLAHDNSAESDSTEADTSYVSKHSPQKAALYSAIFPGLGQLYNKKYWKLPIIYVGFGVLAVILVENSDYYTAWHTAYIAYVNNDIKTLNTYLIPPAHKNMNKLGLTGDWSKVDNLTLGADLKSGNDFYRRWRDLDYIIFGGSYMIVIIDAIVDAHFFEFNVTNDLALKVHPVQINSAYNKSYGINLNLRFDCNKLFKKRNTFANSPY